MDSRRNCGYLFVLPWGLDYTGGVNQVVTNLYRVFRENSWSPLVLVNRWRSRRPHEEIIGGRHIIYFRLRSPVDSRHLLKNLIAFFLYLPYNLACLGFLIRKYQIKVINPHFPDTYLIYFVILKRLGLFKGKIVLSFHGADMKFVLAARGPERKLWKLMIHACDDVVACSNALKRKVLAFVPKLAQRVHVIHNGVDLHWLIKERDTDWSVPAELEGKKVLINIATFEHKKGQDVLLEAFRAVLTEKPEVLLVLIGRSGPTSEMIRTSVRDNGLKEHVLVIEDLPHNRVCAYLERSDIFVLPSRSEPFGIVILEAGGFALPVIASDVDGIPEIITGNETGILVEAEDPRSLANAMLFLLEKPEECKRLGLNLNRRVKENFTWDQAYRKYAALALSG